MGTITTERSDLSKILLVACDQSYDPTAKESQTGNALSGFPDSKDAQGNPIPTGTYRETPTEWNTLVIGWTIEERMFDPATGFGATIFQKTNSDGKVDYIVAMQGTRGPNIQDWSGNLVYDYTYIGDREILVVRIPVKGRQSGNRCEARTRQLRTAGFTSASLLAWRKFGRSESTDINILLKTKGYECRYT